MTGHLLIPALDPVLPATLSPRILHDLLRVELGYDGVVITDGIEMQGVRRTYGLEGATVRALAGGADAICVGGDHADERTAIRLRDAIVAAVRSGELPEERLVAAARRVRRLAAWTLETQTAVGARAAADTAADLAGEPGWALASVIGLGAARRALKVTVAEGAVPPPLTGAPHVVEFAPPINVAIGPETPWGVADQLSELLPGTTSVRLTAGDLEGRPDKAAPVLAGAAGRPLVLVVRDAHRHPWIGETLTHTLAVRPDAIVVEMGLPATVTGGVHLATYGATRACGRAAAEVLAGAPVGVPA
jgi:beta-N-acetylhexosaminidase